MASQKHAYTLSMLDKTQQGHTLQPSLQPGEIVRCDGGTTYSPYKRGDFVRALVHANTDMLKAVKYDREPVSIGSLQEAALRANAPRQSQQLPMHGLPPPLPPHLRAAAAADAAAAAASTVAPPYAEIPPPPSASFSVDRKGVAQILGAKIRIKGAKMITIGNVYRVKYPLSATAKLSVDMMKTDAVYRRLATNYSNKLPVTVGVVTDVCRAYFLEITWADGSCEVYHDATLTATVTRVDVLRNGYTQAPSDHHHYTGDNDECTYYG